MFYFLSIYVLIFQKVQKTSLAQSSKAMLSIIRKILPLENEKVWSVLFCFLDTVLNCSAKLNCVMISRGKSEDTHLSLGAYGRDSLVYS